MIRINPQYWQQRQQELNLYDFKMGRQIRDLLPEPETTKREPVKELNNNYLIQRLDKIQAELNYTRNKLNEHIDTSKIINSLKTSGRL